MFALVLAGCLLPPTHTPAPQPPADADTQRVATVWQIDAAHSELSFRIRHLMGRVRGTFTEWQGTITADTTDWASGTVQVTIQARTIQTNNDRRDADLRSARFFEVDTFPLLTFRSTAVSVTGGAVTLRGDLTIRNTTRPVTLTGSYLGFAPGRDGKDRIGFEVSTTINRLDYGLSWNRAVEGGGLLLGDEVAIDAVIEAVRQVPGAIGAQ